MFTSALRGLTAAYLLMIMLLSLFFSFFVYSVSTNEFETLLLRQAERSLDENSVRLLPNGLPLERETLQAITEEITQSNEKIRRDLYLANFAIFLLGGFLSYALARVTLKPIEEAHESQKRFITDASHELRTPIAVMKTQLEVARRKKLPPEKFDETLTSSLEEVERLASLSESLLKLARSEDKLHDPAVVALHELVTAAKQRIEPKVKNNQQIKVEVSLDHRVHVEEQRIIEVLVILLDNAIKYSSSESTVRIKSEETEQSIKLSVKDSGIGIPASAIPHIFDRFYRVDTGRSKQVEGYGIGLSIAKQTMIQHRGTIGVESERHKGSTFTLYFKNN